MALYTIGDLHLSTAAGKPMDVFGGGWENYMEKLNRGMGILKPDDLLIICGDISWGMNLEESKGDFKYIDGFPGKKIILKGNHDYWWQTAAKTKRFFKENCIETIDILHNNCFFYQNTAICGTRGWLYEQDSGSDHDKKIMNREVMRLETSLAAGGDSEKLVFLHYPPRYNKYVCTEITELLAKYNVRKCYYGHIHGPGLRYAVEGTVEGVEYRMVSADYVDFKLVKIM